MSISNYGAQNERTALAWQRTALSLMAASMLVLRLTVGDLGIAAVVGVGIAFPLALWAFSESLRRYRHHAMLRIRNRECDGLAGIALAAALTLLGALELAAILVG